MRLDQTLFDIRGLLSENKSSLWHFSQGVLQAEGSRGGPSTPADGCSGGSGLLQSQLNQLAAYWYCARLAYSGKGDTEYHQAKIENKPTKTQSTLK